MLKIAEKLRRMCIACRTRKLKPELLRVTHAGGEKALLDPQFKLEGRGAYICQNSNCIKKAQKIRALDRALKCKVDEKFWQELLCKLELSRQNGFCSTQTG